MTDFTLDMTMMFAIHDALRRDLEHVAQVHTRNEGWDLFDRMLHLHHTIEDDLLWPVMRDAVAGQPDDLALIDKMETEHAAIVPLLETLDGALVDSQTTPQARADLDARLREHLTHEEREALPLVDQTLTQEQWMAFGQGSIQRIGADMPRFWPWVLDGAAADTTTHLLGILPAPVRQTYENEWRPTYTTVDRWTTTSSVTEPPSPLQRVPSSTHHPPQRHTAISLARKCHARIDRDPSCGRQSAKEGSTMNEPHDKHSDRQRRFLRELLEENALIDDDVLEIGNDTWAIHGFFPYEGEVQMAMFDTYDEA